MALDEATAGFLAAGAEQGGPALHEMTVEQAREMNAGMTPLYGEGPQMDVRDEQIPGTGGHKIPVRIYTPSDSPKGLFVYNHGGGWMLGDLEGFDTLCRQIADRTNCTVVSVDYRLAPEHRFPAAADDAWDALKWVDQNRDKLSVSADAPLMVGGDSAGGNVSAVSAQRAVRDGGPNLALQVLVYPVTDGDVESASYNDPEMNIGMLTKESMVMFWDAYAPDSADRDNPDASPLRGDVSGTAPALVLIAEHDPLRGEGEAYADKLRAAGVPVEQHLGESQMHGYFTFVNVLPGANVAMDQVTGAINKVVG